MTKKQKLALGISLAMFVIPEIMWSPIANFYYGIIQDAKPGNYYHELRNNFFTNGDNIFFLRCILLVQLLSLMLFLFFFVKYQKINKILKILISIFFIILILISGFALYFILNFNPQIG